MTEQNETQPGRLTRFFGKKTVAYAGVFCLCLLIFEFVCLGKQSDPEVLVFVRHFREGNYLRLLAFLILSFLSVAVTFNFFLAAFASPYRYRGLYFLLFCLTTVGEYSLYKTFGRFSRFLDLETAVFAGDWKFTLNAAILYFNYLALIPILVFGFFLIRIKPVRKKGAALFFSVIMLLGGFFFVTSYVTRNLFYTISFSASCRTLVSFPVIWYVGTFTEGTRYRDRIMADRPRREHYNAPRYLVDFHAQTAPGNNIVFIVDESIRGDHLSLNGYNAITTPFLDELNRKHLIENWGIAVSGTTCSTTSNNLLLTGVTELPDYDFQVFYRPTIFQYAKAMNYKTFYFDGQVSALWNGKPSDRNFIDLWINAEELHAKVANNYEIDAEIARRVKEIVRDSTGNFIWINKFGAHKPYTDSYPGAENVPVKDYRQADYNPAKDPETLRAEYDTAITYNLQSFFSEMLREGLAGDTFYLYTSDHGQTLGENGATVSHCSNTKPESIVPLFMIASPDSLPSLLDTNYQATHANIFPTLLDLMNFPPNERKYKYALSLFNAKAADSAPRYYYAGDLHGVDVGGKYPFD